MARRHQQLTALSIARTRKAGYHLDGDGLYLQVTATGAKSWLYCFTLAGRRREMGLGPYPAVTLAAARQEAGKARAVVKAGEDPIAARDAERARQQLEAALRGITFQQAAEQFIADHEGTWRNPKHRQQWRNTLKTYAYPKIGKLGGRRGRQGRRDTRVGPHLEDQTRDGVPGEGQIERILDWAKGRGHRCRRKPRPLARPTSRRRVSSLQPRFGRSSTTRPWRSTTCTRGGLCRVVQERPASRRWRPASSS